MADITKALAHIQAAITELEESRREQASPIVRDILMQMEQRLHLDVAHLGTLISLQPRGPTGKTGSRSPTKRLGPSVGQRPRRARATKG